MDWEKDYQRKLTTAEEAAKIVNSGERVVVPLGGQPRRLTHALVARARELHDVRVCHFVPDHDPGWLSPGLEKSFQVEVELFIGPNARPATDEKRVPFLPQTFSLGFKSFDERPDERKDIDVVMVAVTPPNKQGFVSFGPHNWFKRAAVQRARRVIAEVNANLIRTYGNCFAHVSQFDYFVEATPKPLTKEEVRASIAHLEPQRKAVLEEIIAQADLEALAPFVPMLNRFAPETLRAYLALEEPPEPARAVAGYLRGMVPHGATIQIGVGTPSSFMPRLGVFDDKIDLGLHTEMVAPGIARLVDAGVITGKHKAVHKGKAVAVAWSGSDSHDFAIIDDNPLFELYDPEYLLNPALIAANPNQIGINNAISVDLTGQINSESVFGGRLINGIGGQPETHLGAIYSRGGRAITLLQSTALEGSVSRIVPQFEAGEIVTIPRFFADTVITEYGVARLMGKNYRERAHELIAIAHPDFRPELKKAARRMFWP